MKTAVIAFSIACLLAACSDPGWASQPFYLQCKSETGLEEFLAKVDEREKSILVYTLFIGCGGGQRHDKKMTFREGHRPGFWVANDTADNTLCRIEWNSKSGAFNISTWYVGANQQLTFADSFTGTCRETEIDRDRFPSN